MRYATIMLMYYFESRASAGAKLASKLIEKYSNEDTVVLALDHGGVAVGYQIATYLHAKLQLLLTEVVHISDESIDFAIVLPGGVVANNPKLSESERNYYYSEYMGELDTKLREARSRINRETDIDEISPESLRDHNIILVSEGLNSSTILDATVIWLKPAHVKKIILACPVISVNALDRAHILMDELCILGTTPNFITTSHYYDNDDVPEKEMIKQMTSASIVNWK